MTEWDLILGTGAACLAVGFLLGLWLRRHDEAEPAAPEDRLEVAKAEAEIADVSVDLTRSTLERRKVERELVREELELEADRIKGHAALESVRVEADVQLDKIARARSNPDLAAGDVVRNRRVELGLTQTGLAERSRVTVRRVADVEAGRGGPDVDLRSIARVLDLDYLPASFARPERDPRAIHDPPALALAEGRRQLAEAS